MRRVLVLIGILLGAAMPVQAASVCAKKTCVEVDVMRTFEEMQRGLQGRDGLAEGKGMLFVFEQNGFHRFWMKEMKFAIDILWLNSQGEIITVAPDCPACVNDPCEVYAPTQEARYVLEVPSGYTLAHHWKLGDRLKLKGIH